MLLSARMIDNVSNVNTFDIVDQVRFTQGDVVDVYFQLIDLNKDTNCKPTGKRYMPATGSTLAVTVSTINTATTLTKTATQPFANDTSIWKIQILATDTISGTFSMKLALTQSSVITYGTVSNALSIKPQTSSLC